MTTIAPARSSLFLLALPILLAGGAFSASAEDSAAELARRAATVFPPLPVTADSPDNPASAAKIELGKLLYFDGRLSKDGTISCNSCHQLDRFGVDGEATSPGVGGQRGGRNSPTTLNAALHFAQFWDGREPTVEAQAKGPVLNPIEMAMPDAASVEAALKGIPGYPPLFALAFPTDDEPVTFDNMALAIGAFERQLLTRSRFDDFVAGDTTKLDAQEQKGLRTFMGAGCITCHQGTLIGGSMFQKVGLVHPYETKDEGRFEVTGNPGDKFVFKVPSLRNITQTGPYFHDGGVPTLSEAIRLMGWHQLGMKLEDEQVEDIVAFLGSLEGTLDPGLSAAPKLP